jgi:hypothetical protein
MNAEEEEQGKSEYVELRARKLGGCRGRRGNGLVMLNNTPLLSSSSSRDDGSIRQPLDRG